MPNPTPAQVAEQINYVGAPTPWPFCFSYPARGKFGTITYQGAIIGGGIGVDEGNKLAEVLNKMHTTALTAHGRAERERLSARRPCGHPQLEYDLGFDADTGGIGCLVCYEIKEKVQEAEAREREACAKVVEQVIPDAHMHDEPCSDCAIMRIAASAIRRRSQEGRT